MQPRKQVMIDFCLEFGRTGKIDVDKMEGLLEVHCSKKSPSNVEKRGPPSPSIDEKNTERPLKKASILVDGTVN